MNFKTTLIFGSLHFGWREKINFLKLKETTYNVIFVTISRTPTTDGATIQKQNDRLPSTTQITNRVTVNDRRPTTCHHRPYPSRFI